MASTRERVREHRARSRAQGLRPVQIWILDVRAPADTGKPKPVMILQIDRFDATASVTICPLDIVRARRFRAQRRPSRGRRFHHITSHRIATYSVSVCASRSPAAHRSGDGASCGTSEVIGVGRFGQSVAGERSACGTEAVCAEVSPVRWRRRGWRRRRSGRTRRRSRAP